MCFSLVVFLSQGQPSQGMVSVLCTAACTSMSLSCCSVRAVTPSPAGTASSTPIRTTSEYDMLVGGACSFARAAPRPFSVCPQIPVPGRCSEEPAQAPGLTGEAPRGQACDAAEEHQGGSQLVSVEARAIVGGGPGGAPS